MSSFRNNWLLIDHEGPSFPISPNGKMQMKISGAVGKVYIVEASTNLVDWEAVGVATVNQDGLFEFDDSDAPKHQSRFYRVREP